MSIILMLVFLGVAALMILMILLQEGKGGGLTGMSSGMDTVMGARNPLRRWTAYFFVAFVVLAIGINWLFYRRSLSEIPQGDDLPPAIQTMPRDEWPLDPDALTVPPSEGAIMVTTATAPEAAPAAPATTATTIEAAPFPAEMQAPVPDPVAPSEAAPAEPAPPAE